MAIVANNSVKDSRWLQLEVCREFTRNKCTRPDQECKFAHPPSAVEVTGGRVVACYDSIKGRCNREKPPCKYFHPPQHLKDQLLINGRNHLALKNALLHHQIAVPTAVLTGQLPVTAPGNHYLTSVPGNPYGGAPGSNPYATPYPFLIPSGHLMTSNQLTAYGLVPAHPQTLIAPPPPSQPPASNHKSGRSDRLEVCREFQRGNCKRNSDECKYAHPPDSVHVDPADGGLVTVCMDFMKGRCSRDSCRYMHPPPHLQNQLKLHQVRTAAAIGPSHQQQHLISHHQELILSSQQQQQSHFHHHHQQQQQQQQQQHLVNHYTAASAAAVAAAAAATNSQIVSLLPRPPPAIMTTATLPSTAAAVVGTAAPATYHR